MEAHICIIATEIIFPMLLKPLLARAAGHVKVTVCTSFNDIDQKVIAEQTKLIIMDGGISDFSPEVAIHYLRAHNKVLAPIWFFPEMNCPTYFYKLKQLGVNRIVNKPFDPVSIAKEVDSIIFSRI